MVFTGFISFLRKKFYALFQDFFKTQIDFPGLQISPYTLSLPQLQNQFSLESYNHFF